jgi:HEAT repeat protein
MSERTLKKELVAHLRARDLAGVMALLQHYTARQLVNPLIGCLCHRDEMVKWLAVAALGRVVAALAGQDLEAGRVVMRRFMWMLNDESGGIGWGVPEAMAEVMACHAGLADEFHQVLVAQMREDGNYLELAMLQRGLMWGLGRLARVRPELLRLRQAPRYLLPYLDSADAEVRGRAAWALGPLAAREAEKPLARLRQDRGVTTIFTGNELTINTVGALAEAALQSIQAKG